MRHSALEGAGQVSFDNLTARTLKVTFCVPRMMSLRFAKGSQNETPKRSL